MIDLLIMVFPFIVAGLVILWIFGIKPDMKDKKIIRDFYEDNRDKRY